MTRNARIAGWTLAGAVAVGGVGVGIAQAADPSPSPTSSSSSSPSTPGPNGGHPGAKHRVRPGVRARARGLGGRAMHGEFVVRGKDGKPTTVDVQRGSVTAVSSTSITLKSDDGFTATYAVSSSTRVRIGVKGATTAQVRTGEQAAVVARKDGGTATAQIVTAHQK